MFRKNPFQPYDCLLLNKGWSVEEVVAFYEDNGIRVREFWPAEGKIWLYKDQDR